MGEANDPQPSDWRQLHVWQIQPVRDGLLLLGIFGLLYLGYALRLVTVPILLALTLAYLFEPVVARITRSGHISRQFAAVMIIVATVLTITVPIAVGGAFAVLQGVTFADRIATNMDKAGKVVEAYPPDYEILTPAPAEDGPARPHPSPDSTPPADPTEENAEADAASASGGLGATDGEGSDRSFLAELTASFDAFEHWIEHEASEEVRQSYESLTNEAWRGMTCFAAVAFPEDFIAQLLSGAENNLLAAMQVGLGASTGAAATVGDLLRRLMSVGVLFFGAFLTAFFFFFMSSGYARVLDYLAKLIPDRNRDLTVDLIQKMDRVVAGFIRGRITIALIQSVIFSIAYFLAGVPAALLLGVAVGFLSIIPYLALIGLPASVILLLLDPPGGFRGEPLWIILAPIAIYFGVQALDDYVWTPMIQGKQTGLDTPTVLFASIAGGVLGGFYGLLLAIPVAACIKILLQEIFWPRFHAWAAGEAVDPLPFGKSGASNDSSG